MYLPGFEPDIEKWTSDDWETPNDIAAAIARLITIHEINILEPTAGNGQIVKNIPFNKRVWAIEQKEGRYVYGADCSRNCSFIQWINADFLSTSLEMRFDVIVTNPPFSLRMEFIERSLQLLKSNGRLLFLLPIDFYCGNAMGDKWRQLPCYIYKQYTIQYRVPYLNSDGVPQKGRRVYDAVFDIRKIEGRGWKNSEAIIFL